MKTLDQHPELNGKMIIEFSQNPIKEGGLYTVFQRLVKKGVIEVSRIEKTKHRPSPFYKLTPKGKVILTALQQLETIE